MLLPGDTAAASIATASERRPSVTAGGDIVTTLPAVTLAGHRAAETEDMAGGGTEVGRTAQTPGGHAATTG